MRTAVQRLRVVQAIGLASFRAQSARANCSAQYTINNRISNQVGLPAELKHITKPRKRN